MRYTENVTVFVCASHMDQGKTIYKILVLASFSTTPPLETTNHSDLLLDNPTDIGRSRYGQSAPSASAGAYELSSRKLFRGTLKSGTKAIQMASYCN